MLFHKYYVAGTNSDSCENKDLSEQGRLCLFGKILPTNPAPEDLKIAFLYYKTPETSSWAYAHELGRLHLEQAFDGKVKTIAI